MVLVGRQECFGSWESMSLVSLCIQTLLPYVDQIHLPYRLQPRSTTLDELIPDPAHIDTRLWAALIQIYDNLPPFLTYHKTDATHLPLLQSIPSTPSFSLITLLELSSCPHLNDSSILELRFIHTLTAFDATGSTLSPYGIKTLASFTGLWQLRILSLRKCRHITNDAFPHFVKFPLLSVLGLSFSLYPTPFIYINSRPPWHGLRHSHRCFSPFSTIFSRSSLSSHFPEGCLDDTTHSPLRAILICKSILSPYQRSPAPSNSSKYTRSHASRCILPYSLR